MEDTKYVYILQQKTIGNNVPTILEVMNREPSRLELYNHIMPSNEPTETGLLIIQMLLSNSLRLMDETEEPIGYNTDDKTFFLSKHKVDWEIKE